MSETVNASAENDKFSLIVNGQQHAVDSRIVSFEEVVKLADLAPPSPDTRYTVTYRNAAEPKEGSLAPGHSVEIKKKGTIFNVKATGKS